MAKYRLNNGALWFLGAWIAVTVAGCGDSGGSTASSARDAEIRTLGDRPLPDMGRLVPDIAAIMDCVEGETRPCGTDEGECVGGVENCGGGLWDGDCVGSRGPVEERCNEADDDCDGLTDEDFRLGVTCKFTDARGIQRDGLQQCELETGGVTCEPGMDCRPDDDADGSNVCEDCDDSDPTAHPGAAELCDGVDNDCNSRTDETFPLDEACVAGDGVCRRGGRYTCGLAGALACSATPLEPDGPELCGDALDNDCDGETDEGFAVDAPCTLGLGVCVREGTYRCTDTGDDVVCDAQLAIAGDELCGNGLDDDCDGETDEDFALGLPCDVGVGACGRTGLLLCDAATGATLCSVAVGSPSPELCGNLVDDDCDGDTDEGFAVGEVCSAGEGECRRTGTTVCGRDGRSTACNVEAGAPHEELCGTQVDEDCDGLVDEGFDVGVICTAGEGECARLGVIECTLNRLDTLCGAEPGPPVLETCNGLDDDCDGQTDEGFNVGGPCSAGIGACRRDATIGCDVNGELYCRAQAAPADLERCGNLEDDDCDGTIDEGYDVGELCTSGFGACAVQGRRICDFDGQQTICDAQAGLPRPEICGNGLDEDCDGTVDEGFDLGAPCQVGVGTCRRSGSRICGADGISTACDVTAGLPQLELCGTAADEDCDGQTDEGFNLGVACSAGEGECARRGQTICAADALSAICGASPGQPVSERCDGLDNNCDGRVDDGFNLGGACRSGLGPCAVAGQLVCRPDGAAAQCNSVPLPPQPEVCDNLDNDCDGSIDEDFPDLSGPCDSSADADLCTLGAYACDLATGEQTCVGDIPTPELCDYRDNDCDGTSDNGFDLESDENNCGTCGGVCAAPFGTCLRAVCYRQYWVDDDTGSNANGLGSRARPWRTLTFALTRVTGPRALISILPGLYSATMHATEFETFPIELVDGVEIEGFGPLGSVVLDAALQNGILRANNLRDVNNRLENLVLERAGTPVVELLKRHRAAVNVATSVLTLVEVKIQNANGAAFTAAIDVGTNGAGGSTVVCEHCTFANNRATSGADTVYVAGASTLRLNRCDFHGNTVFPNVDGVSESNGVVGVDDGRIEFTNTTFVNNLGSALRVLSFRSVAVLTNCSIAGNSGSGVVIADGLVTLHNTIIASNQRYGVFEGSGVAEPVALWNSLFFGNTLGNYLDENRVVQNTAAGINGAVSGGTGRGTLVADPNFFSLPGGNLRLRLGSPAINAADATVAPSVDQDGNVRPRGVGPDIGAFEF